MRHILAISARTNAEWPADHPLRKVTRVLTPDQADNLSGYLICSFVGEPRQPLAPDDHDITGACCRCGQQIVYRASAPKHFERLCLVCWRNLFGASYGEGAFHRVRAALDAQPVKAKQKSKRKKAKRRSKRA